MTQHALVFAPEEGSEGRAKERNETRPRDGCGWMDECTRMHALCMARKRGHTGRRAHLSSHPHSIRVRASAHLPHHSHRNASSTQDRGSQHTLRPSVVQPVCCLRREMRVGEQTLGNRGMRRRRSKTLCSRLLHDAGPFRDYSRGQGLSAGKPFVLPGADLQDLSFWEVEVESGGGVVEMEVEVEDNNSLGRFRVRRHVRVPC
jgi:hypothetical protein